MGFTGKSQGQELQQDANRAAAHHTTNSQEIAAFDDNRDATSAQRKLIQDISASPQFLAQRQLQGRIDAGMQPLQRMVEEEEPLQGKIDTAQRVTLEEDELLQGRFDTAQRAAVEEEVPLQGKQEVVPPANKTGIPDNLKSGIESLSGMDMSDVRVHRNSSKPAQLNAHAYAQGNDIHLAAGQEQHLPHEAWHVVQQRQGRVKPTMQMAGQQVNDDASLENEADVMGGRALSVSGVSQRMEDKGSPHLTTEAKGCIQAMWWTYISGVWYPDGETSNPVPTHVAENGARYDDGLDVGSESDSEEEETIDDLKLLCTNDPLSVGNYNKGWAYAVGAFIFKGHKAHSSNNVHKNPKSRLQEMHDAGASIPQIKEVMRLWGRY